MKIVSLSNLLYFDCLSPLHPLRSWLTQRKSTAQVAIRASPMSHRQVHAARRISKRGPVPCHLHTQRFFADHLNPD